VISSPSQQQTTGRPSSSHEGNGLESAAVVPLFHPLPSLYRFSDVRWGAEVARSCETPRCRSRQIAAASATQPQPTGTVERPGVPSDSGAGARALLEAARSLGQRGPTAVERAGAKISGKGTSTLPASHAKGGTRSRSSRSKFSAPAKRREGGVSPRKRRATLQPPASSDPAAHADRQIGGPFGRWAGGRGGCKAPRNPLQPRNRRRAAVRPLCVCRCPVRRLRRVRRVRRRGRRAPRARVSARRAADPAFR